MVETCLYVDDLAAAEQFYTTVLGLEVMHRKPGRHVFCRCGDQMLLLFDAAATSQPSDGVGAHGARGSVHIAFALDPADLPAWRRRLTSHGVAIEEELHTERGHIFVYFRDPAGNLLELVTPGAWGLPAGGASAIAAK